MTRTGGCEKFKTFTCSLDVRTYSITRPIATFLIKNWLLARRKNFCREFARGFARIPPGSAQIRRTSAENFIRRTPPNIRRTFGGLRRSPRGYGWIRAESAANWRKSSLEKCLPTKTSLTPRFPAEKIPPWTSFRRRNNSRVRVRVRVRVMVL